MAGNFWDNWFGGGDQAPRTVDVLQKLADGNTHTLRYAADSSNKPVGSPTDMGIETAKDPKAPPTNKPLVKTLADGSTWAFAFNADGTVKDSTQLAAPGGKPVDPSLSGERDARTALVNQQLANAEAIAPYNLDKAKAVIDNLNARTDLLPAQQALIDARVQRIASQNGVDPSRIALNQANAGKAGATTGKLDAQTEVILQGAFAGLQQKYAQIDSLMGKPGGPADQAAADALKKQVFDQAAREAATGLTANQAATNATTQRGQDITQADARAGQMSSFLSNYGRDISTAKMPPGSTGAGDFLGAMLGHWGDLMGTAGGNPVPASGAATQAAPAGAVPAPTGGGLSIQGLPPADLQRIHDRTQQLAASGMDLGSAAKQAMGEYVSGTPAPGAAPAAQFDGAAGAQPADPLAGINPGYKIPAGQPGSFLGSMVGSA